MKNIITKTDAKICVDGVNYSYFENTAEGREILRRDCLLMDLDTVYADVMRVWGDAPIPVPLENLKREKLRVLSAEYEGRIHGHFTTSQNFKMQFDTSDALKMQGAITLMEATGTADGYLTQADDTTVYNVPLDTMKAVLIEMMTAFAACHARKQELRAAINAAQTVEDLDAIKITWPL